MEQEFLNLYIEKLTKKLEDYTRLDILQQTQLEMAQRLTAQQAQQIAELTEKIEKLEASLNKKASKTKENNDF